jgi:hypothetical protein
MKLAGVSRKVAVHLPPNGWRLGVLLGGILAGAAWLAAFLDVVENLALIQLLIGRGEGRLPALAAWCAWPKFGIAVFILLYIVTGGAIIFMKRSRA